MFEECLDVTQHALERSDYLLRPPAPQEQSFALTRRRHHLYATIS
jgi:hypothetical protein